MQDEDGNPLPESPFASLRRENERLKACLRGIDLVLSTGTTVNEFECSLLRKGIAKALSGDSADGG